MNGDRGLESPTEGRGQSGGKTPPWGGVRILWTEEGHRGKGEIARQTEQKYSGLVLEVVWKRRVV